MITVLADDITGAAEIAGIGLRFGLNVRFDFAGQLQEIPSADVWVIASDTRSLPEKEACETVQKTAEFLSDNRIRSIFKKIDSALRGHVKPEIDALLAVIPKKQVFILPANPEMGRTIQDRVYYINDQPLNETSFADDPDFPAYCALVDKRLNIIPGGNYQAQDCVHPNDFQAYAELASTDDTVLPVGGSAFFESYLQTCFPNVRKLKTIVNQSFSLGNMVLMVCGSTHETAKRFIRETKDFSIVEIPLQEITGNDWANRIVERFQRHKRILLTVSGHCSVTNDVSASQIKDCLASITRQVIRQYPVEELFIEGGATAYALIRACGFSALIPVEEYARGVVRLKIPDKENLYVTIKPGSYEWPENLFQI
ncbi:MAG: four-carbon acid sugar kinase family protein [Dysgonamonadaceae bacterium]|jgi:uncharacterized protein YgbK (DUF1537 family)|nr:four-carbon acid sugar kinase family protein [Dysgonamonadaceae bacterium]